MGSCVPLDQVGLDSGCGVNAYKNKRKKKKKKKDWPTVEKRNSEMVKGPREKSAIWPFAPGPRDLPHVFVEKASWLEPQSPPQYLGDDCVNLVGTGSLKPVCGVSHKGPGTQKVGDNGEGPGRRQWESSSGSGWILRSVDWWFSNFHLPKSHQRFGLHPPTLWSRRLEVGLRMCNANKFPVLLVSLVQV